MKDIKSEILKNLDAQSSDEHRKIQVLGEQRSMPKDVFLSHIKNLSIYEIDDVSDIAKHKAELLKKVRVPFRVFFWSMNLYSTIRKSRLHKEYRTLYKKYGHMQRKVEGDDATIRDMLLLRVQKKTLLYITNVQLRNFKKTTSPLISVYEFDIVDSRNNTIRGVIKYDSFFDGIVSQCDPDVVKNKSLLETARASESGHHYMVTGVLLDGQYRDENMQSKSRETRILVTKIDDGGRLQKVTVPLVKF